MRRVTLAGLAAVALLSTAASAHAADPLYAGAGRADITPPTGFYFMGWVRSDAKGTGVNTRLYVRVIVLRRGAKKVALVAEDLNGIPGGMLADAAKLDKDLGYDQTNVLDSASHTHAGPAGFYNFTDYNTVFPTPDSVTEFSLTTDPQLYTFMVKRLALAIRRADADQGPAAAGWGGTQILGLTENRSIEAHLANHGIFEPYGTGNAEQDPLGYADTIDPDVNVLRVDKLVRGRHVPIGMWSTFADHGTVNKATWLLYNADHHGAATRDVESYLRARAVKAGAPRQEIVNAYGNTDEGDISAGLHRGGPAAAQYVGDREAAAMLKAWKSAGAVMSTTPALDFRWTRVCFCGQAVGDGTIASSAQFGQPQLTGSEEGRGGLYQLTGVPLEGQHAPMGLPYGPQGDKINGFGDTTGNGFPKGAPLMAVRIADHMIVSIPGEMTEAMGRRVRQAVLDATKASGIRGVVISGLANEYISYFTTPEEYDQQHYEGGSTLYGRLSSVFLQEQDVDLAKRLVAGQPAPDAYPYDPINGMTMVDQPYPTGVSSASAVAQPSTTARLARAAFSWTGAPKGADMPLDHAFVTIQAQSGRRWRHVTDDLGLQIIWVVDDSGGYKAQWEVPLSQPPGTYRFVVTANHFTLTSSPFSVVPSRALIVREATPPVSGRVGVTLGYPAAVQDIDITARPEAALGGSVAFLVDGKTVVVRHRDHGVFSVAIQPNSTVSIAAGGAGDLYRNVNDKPVNLRPGPQPQPTPPGQA